MISNELKVDIFEKMTGIIPLKCFDDNAHLVMFIVAQGHLKQALGKGASHAAKVKLAIGLPVKIIEIASTLEQFCKNVCLPIVVETKSEIVDNLAVVTLITETYELRGRLIGRDAGILRSNEKVVKHFFPQLKEIKVEQKIGEIE